MELEPRPEPGAPGSVVPWWSATWFLVMGVARWMVDFMDNPVLNMDELGVALFKKISIFFLQVAAFKYLLVWTIHYLIYHWFNHQSDYKMVVVFKVGALKR